jgi:hypothetical protein
MNLNPATAELREMLRAADDDAGTHVLWLTLGYQKIFLTAR